MGWDGMEWDVVGRDGVWCDRIGSDHSGLQVRQERLDVGCESVDVRSKGFELLRDACQVWSQSDHPGGDVVECREKGLTVYHQHAEVWSEVRYLVEEQLQVRDQMRKSRHEDLLQQRPVAVGGRSQPRHCSVSVKCLAAHPIGMQSVMLVDAVGNAGASVGDNG